MDTIILPRMRSCWTIWSRKTTCLVEDGNVSQWFNMDYGLERQRNSEKTKRKDGPPWEGGCGMQWRTVLGTWEQRWSRIYSVESLARMVRWVRKREVLNLTLGFSASNTQRDRGIVQNKAELGMTQRGTEDESPSWDMGIYSLCDTQVSASSWQQNSKVHLWGQGLEDTKSHWHIQG